MTQARDEDVTSNVDVDSLDGTLRNQRYDSIRSRRRGTDGDTNLLVASLRRRSTTYQAKEELTGNSKKQTIIRSFAKSLNDLVDKVASHYHSPCPGWRFVQAVFFTPTDYFLSLDGEMRSKIYPLHQAKPREERWRVRVLCDGAA